MARFKTPDFNERSAAARAAKESALEKLRNKPVADPAVIAEREATRVAREAAAAERRAERQRAIEEEKAARAAARAAEEEANAPKPQKSAEELKALRDLRYAARKARKK